MTNEESIKFKKAKQKSNKIGMRILREILNQGIKAKLSKRKGYDIDLMSGDNLVGYVETSFRNISSKEYDYAILTEGKIARLHSLPVRSLYICIYNDGSYFIWEARKMKAGTEEKFCPVTSVVNNGMKTKKCYKYYLKDAYLKGKVLLTDEERRKL